MPILFLGVVCSRNCTIARGSGRFLRVCWKNTLRVSIAPPLWEQASYHPKRRWFSRASPHPTATDHQSDLRVIPPLTRAQALRGCQASRPIWCWWTVSRCGASAKAQGWTWWPRPSRGLRGMRCVPGAGKGWEALGRAGGAQHGASNGRIFSRWNFDTKLWSQAWFIWYLLQMNPTVVEIRASPFEETSIALWSRGRIWTWSERLIKKVFLSTPSISNMGGLDTRIHSFPQHCILAKWLDPTLNQGFWRGKFKMRSCPKKSPYSKVAGCGRKSSISNWQIFPTPWLHGRSKVPRHSCWPGTRTGNSRGKWWSSRTPICHLAAMGWGGFGGFMTLKNYGTMMKQRDLIPMI